MFRHRNSHHRRDQENRLQLFITHSRTKGEKHLFGRRKKKEIPGGETKHTGNHEIREESMLLQNPIYNRMLLLSQKVKAKTQNSPPNCTQKKKTRSRNKKERDTLDKKNPGRSSWKYVRARPWSRARGREDAPPPPSTSP